MTSAPPAEDTVHTSPRPSLIRRIGISSVLGMSAITGTAGTALLGFLGPPIQQVVAAIVPQPVIQTVDNLFMHDPKAETPSLYGEVYEIVPGQYQPTILATAGQTTPNGHNIPSGAVVNKRVVLGVEGINAQPSDYAYCYNPLLESDQIYNLGQPIVMVHEGTDATQADNIKRIGNDYASMKKLELGLPVSASDIFKSDPSVQSTYNLVKQSLDQGNSILLVVHSGGGTISSLALNLLAHQPGYESKIGSQVRVLSFAGVASAQDYHDAGVSLNNVLYVGDHQDAVAQLGSVYVKPDEPASGIARIVDALTHQATDFSGGSPHNPQTIMDENLPHVLSFLQGGPGGTYLH